MDIVSKGFNGSTTALELALGAYGAGKVRWSSYDGTKHGITPSVATLSPVWTHLVGTFDGATWRLYIDGVLDSSVVDPVGSRTNDQKWAIGGVFIMAAIFSTFDGLVDEVRLSNSLRGRNG